MVKKKHNKDKKLHNSDEKLHNSQELDLSWQETVDLIPEDELEGGSEIYYSVDEDGNVHSREFLAEELIEDDSKDLEDSLEGKSRSTTQKLNTATQRYARLIRSQSLQDCPRAFIRRFTTGHLPSLSLSRLPAQLQRGVHSNQKMPPHAQNRPP
jgi:hypothetical protein